MISTKAGPVQVPDHELEYEMELRSYIASFRQAEEEYRTQRQQLEIRLGALLRKRCPPAFERCILEDGTSCPFYHDGQCVNAKEVEA